MADTMQPGPRPQWVRTLNSLGDPAWIALDEQSLLAEAVVRTGLDDFGGSSFREPLTVFLDSLEREARLNLTGRILARSDVLNLLENRLRIAETRKRNPEIAEERIEAPIFITGLPRTGTSILHELLGQNPANRLPLAWEVRHPCPPPETASYDSDPRIAQTDGEIGFWNLVVPEYKAIHEVGARIPVECINLTAHEFASDFLSGCHQVPTYAAWLAGADLHPAYEYHRSMLQLLQWRCPGDRWVLKAPSHLAALETLLDVYPDARIVQTHRDPLAVIASVASTLYATAWIRSDHLDGKQVLAWFSGEACERLLEGAMRVRDAGRIDPDRIHDVRYSDLLADPIGAVAAVHEHFGIPFGERARRAVREHIEGKPKHKHGVHAYAFSTTGLDAAAERARFSDYQQRYSVVAEL